MDLSTILRTEHALLGPICEITEKDGYQVYRSEKYPSYYSGNGIEIAKIAEGQTLAHWERTFADYFEATRFVHKTFTFLDEPQFAPLIAEATVAGYHVDHESYRFVDHTRLAQHAVPNGYEVRKVETEAQWAMMKRFVDIESQEEDWYDPNAEDDPLFRMTREVSEAVSATWYYLSPVDDDCFHAQLGIFEHEGVCRLLDVMTSRDHRRKGLALSLVSYAIRDAVETRRSTGLCLCADRDNDAAIKLYQGVGLVEIGGATTLMDYPVLNAATSE